MGRRKGNSLEQRTQRAHQRSQQRLEEAQVAKEAAAQAALEAAEAEAKAIALQVAERQKAEERKARLIEDFQNGKGFVFRSQKEWGGEISGNPSLFPFIWVEYHSYPNGSSYYQAKSLVEGVCVSNVYGRGVDLGIHFFNKDLVEVLVS